MPPRKRTATPPPPPPPPPSPPPDLVDEVWRWMKRELSFAARVALKVVGAMLVHRWITQLIQTGFLNKSVFDESAAGHPVIASMMKAMMQTENRGGVDGTASARPSDSGLGSGFSETDPDDETRH